MALQTWKEHEENRTARPGRFEWIWPSVAVLYLLAMIWSWRGVFALLKGWF